MANRTIALSAAFGLDEAARILPNERMARELMETLEKNPSLLNKIRELQLDEWFSRVTLERARQYASDGRVAGLETKLEDRRALVILAVTHGTRSHPYYTTIRIEPLSGEAVRRMHTDCTCPVAISCKHAAAALMCLQAVATLAPDSSSGLPRFLQEWISDLQQASHQARAQADGTKDSKGKKFLAYCLEQSSYAETGIEFIPRPASYTADGHIRVEDAVARADPTKPARYMDKEDCHVVLLYHQLVHQQNGWQSAELMGETGAELLKRALDTGRLFVGERSRDYRPSSNYRPVVPGEGLQVTPRWIADDEGRLRPGLKGLSEGVLLLPTVPMHALDWREARVFSLKSDMPAGALKLWMDGPAIDARQARQLSEQLLEGGFDDLPAPITLETRQQAKTPPVAHLHVKVHPLDDGESLPLGFATLRYGDSRPIPAAATATPPPSSHNEVHGDLRLVWQRDLDAERTLMRALGEHGLIPASRGLVMHQRATDPAMANGFIPEDEDLSPLMEWYTWQQQHMEGLRAKGWTIEFEPEALPGVHDISGFAPAMEARNDHGIDWFRFDLSVEIEGKKVSLIPMIAHAIEMDLPPADDPQLPEWTIVPMDEKAENLVRIASKPLMEMVERVRHLFQGASHENVDHLRLDRLQAADLADEFALNDSATNRSLAKLGRSLKNIRGLPDCKVPQSVKASLRAYQEDGYRWLCFLGAHGLNGILADDMGLGKTLQTLTWLSSPDCRKAGKPSLIVAPTSVVPNWAAEAKRFTPRLKVLSLHGPERHELHCRMHSSDLVITSYALLHRDIEILGGTDWHAVILDEAQQIKNPNSVTAKSACKLTAQHRLCLTGTPMENHLGELWSLMRFLMPGLLPDQKTFNRVIRRPIERDQSSEAQLALSRRISPLILRRTKDQVASDLPPKTQLVHHVDLGKKQIELYESVRATMDKRVRDAIAAKGLAKSHIIVLDALLKLRQICCHPSLVKSRAANKVNESAKLEFLTQELLPQLLEEGRRILLFSQFTSMLGLIEEHLKNQSIAYLKLTGRTRNRAQLVRAFQAGEAPVFLISLKAGGTGLNLTAADTVIHFDPWWNPAAEDQATDRAHRIGQDKPVFVHKLVCRGSIEDRILELQARKATLAKALLSEKTTSLRIDNETLGQLLAPIQ